MTWNTNMDEAPLTPEMLIKAMEAKPVSVPPGFYVYSAAAERAYLDAGVPRHLVVRVRPLPSPPDTNHDPK